MSLLSPLLDIQELDLTADRLRRKRATLPELAALAESEATIARLDREREPAEAEREVLASAEREIGGEVASYVSKAKEVEASLYAGTVTIAKELDSLQQELEMWQRKQEEAEERELELLEQIESADSGLAQQRSLRSEQEVAAERIRGLLTAAEAAIDEEIAALKEQRDGLRGPMPAPVLALYDRLRANARLGGQAAVALGKGMCEGCNLDLPVMEYRRIKEEPEDAAVFCVHCTRLLVR